ncbi:MULTISPECIES: N-formylglutamate deformylase [unclassified Roseitalea]|uniref:N-formylglutamate deformylase n=1 Tax=unclassified Roseitalea TaxID=2639107 RepID=UPI00273D7F94|nr:MULTISPECIES: N-formylglutamate deformylase [unclassified Roseitalea]
MSAIEVHRGNGPVVLGLPHTGTDIPAEVCSQLNAAGLAVADTDWHVHDLYAGLLPDVTTVRTLVSRYVIDVNRDPSGRSLYPGQNTTALCPTTDFDGQPIYKEGLEPGRNEIQRRLKVVHWPYHGALARELQRVKDIHGFVILYDAHSIRSRIPHLFEGVLPDFNIGTDGCTTCDDTIETAVCEICKSADGYSYIVNGRFRGGWTTRKYGNPGMGVHAIQMELAQSTYMDEAPPWRYRPERARLLRSHLRDILTTLSLWRPI